MKEKELKIEVPVGYEIDKEHSTFDKIVLKKKDSRPKSWAEFCEQTYVANRAYVDNRSAVYRIDCIASEGKRMHPVIDRNLLPSIEVAEKMRAFMQLVSLRKAWVREWEPDWTNKKEKKYCVCLVGNAYTVHETETCAYALSFAKEEDAYEFVKCFEGLLKEADDLI